MLGYRSTSELACWRASVLSCPHANTLCVCMLTHQCASTLASTGADALTCSCASVLVCSRARSNLFMSIPVLNRIFAFLTFKFRSGIDYNDPQLDTVLVSSDDGLLNCHASPINEDNIPILNANKKESTRRIVHCMISACALPIANLIAMNSPQSNTAYLRKTSESQKTFTNHNVVLRIQ